MSQHCILYSIFKYVRDSNDIHKLAKSCRESMFIYKDLTKKEVNDERIFSIIDNVVSHICGSKGNDIKNNSLYCINEINNTRSRLSQVNGYTTKIVINNNKVKNGMNTIKVEYHHITGLETINIKFYYCVFRRKIINRLKTVSKEHNNIFVFYSDKDKTYEIFSRYSIENGVKVIRYITINGKNKNILQWDNHNHYTYLLTSYVNNSDLTTSLSVIWTTPKVDNYKEIKYYEGELQWPKTLEEVKIKLPIIIGQQPHYTRVMNRYISIFNRPSMYNIDYNIINKEYIVIDFNGKKHYNLPFRYQKDIIIEHFGSIQIITPMINIFL